MRFRKQTVYLVVAIFFGAANLISYYLMPEESTLSDGFVEFGWPFSMYAYGGFWTHSVYLWTGLVGNVFVALATSRVLWWTTQKFAHRPKKTLLPVFIIACSVLSSSAALAQTGGNTKAEPARRVEGQVMPKLFRTLPPCSSKIAIG